MKQNNNILVGLFFVILGILFLLRNFNLFHFRIDDVFRLWPFALIFIGVRTLPIDEGLRSKLETGVIILFFLALISLPHISKSRSHHWPDRERLDFNNDSNETGMTDSKSIRISKV